LPHNLLQTNPCIRHNFSTQVLRKRAAQLHHVGPELRYIFWPPLEARKCSAAQGPHGEVVPRAFWRLMSKSCDECKGSFARGCEAKRWSHWTCSSLGIIFQPMRINSLPDVKCFCYNKNVLCAQSMVWHFVRHPVYKKPKNALQCLWIILFTQFSPTSFGRHSGHPQGDAVIQEYENTNVVNCVIITT